MVEQVLRCRRVHQLLEKKDSELYSHIAKVHQVEPQLYVLRWLRLVFTREFHIDDVRPLLPARPSGHPSVTASSES